METVKANFEAITEYLNSLSDSELVQVHNEYCQGNQDSDLEIYTNDEDFFSTFFDGKVIEAVRAATCGKYKFSDDWVKFDGYANLQSFNNPTPEVDIPSIAADILENPDHYSDIELEEEEEEEETNEDEEETQG